jgi:hypothetical protein
MSTAPEQDQSEIAEVLEAPARAEDMPAVCRHLIQFREKD